MAKRLDLENNTKEKDLYRFMCFCEGGPGYCKDFTTKESALEYVDTMDDSKIEWYGVYYWDRRINAFKHVVSERLKPHNDTIVIKSKNVEKPKRSRKSKES